VVVEVTKADLDRVYDKLDELTGQVSNTVVAQTQTATILSGLKEALDQQSKDRAATCPTRPDTNRLLAFAYAVGGKEDPVAGASLVVNRVNTMWGLGKWVGGMLTAAILIPGLWATAQWIGRQVAQVIGGG
jgi:hypothetical protein